MIKGSKASAETRERMRAATLGRPKSPEHRAAIAAALRGKPRPSLLGNQNAAGHHWTEEERVEIAERVRTSPVIGECAYCGAPARTTDHVPCCRACNAAKSDRTPEEWFVGSLRGRNRK